MGETSQKLVGYALETVGKRGSAHTGVLAGKHAQHVGVKCAAGTAFPQSHVQSRKVEARIVGSDIHGGDPEARQPLASVLEGEAKLGGERPDGPETRQRGRHVDLAHT